MDAFEKQMVRALEMHRQLSKINVPKELNTEELKERIQQIAQKALARLSDSERAESLDDALTRIAIKRGLMPPPPG
jgi:hypothetical protein